MEVSRVRRVLSYLIDSGLLSELLASQTERAITILRDASSVSTRPGPWLVPAGSRPGRVLGQTRKDELPTVAGPNPLLFLLTRFQSSCFLVVPTASLYLCIIASGILPRWEAHERRCGRTRDWPDVRVWHRHIFGSQAFCSAQKLIVKCSDRRLLSSGSRVR
jgi:hypothetical protein